MRYVKTCYSRNRVIFCVFNLLMIKRNNEVNRDASFRLTNRNMTKHISYHRWPSFITKDNIQMSATIILDVTDIVCFTLMTSNNNHARIQFRPFKKSAKNDLEFF